jgi:hypothetical protein
MPATLPRPTLHPAIETSADDPRATQLAGKVAVAILSDHQYAQLCGLARRERVHPSIVASRLLAAALEGATAKLTTKDTRSDTPIRAD